MIENIVKMTSMKVKWQHLPNIPLNEDEANIISLSVDIFQPKPQHRCILSRISFTTYTPNNNPRGKQRNRRIRLGPHPLRSRSASTPRIVCHNYQRHRIYLSYTINKGRWMHMGGKSRHNGCYIVNTRIARSTACCVITRLDKEYSYNYSFWHGCLVMYIERELWSIYCNV